MDSEKKFKQKSIILAIIIILLLIIIIIPDGFVLPTFQIGFEASPKGVGATINKPTGSEIVALILILVFFTLWIYMYFRYKKEINTKSSKKK